MTKDCALISTILDNTIDSIIATDEQGLLVLFNKSAERLLGYTQEEILGRPLDLLLPHKESTQHAGYIANYLKSGKATIMGKERELFARHKNGTIFLVGITINEAWQDQKRYFTAIFRDISERKYLEESLIKTKEEAEAANRKKSLFLANISHDIRTPMNGIIGMSELLLNTEQNKEQKHYTNIIISSAELLLSLINDLLDISKIESLESIELNPQTINLHEIIEDIQNSFITQAQKNNVTLTVHIDDRLPNAITVDTLRLSQILVNLVGNALKFTKFGTVDIRLKNKGVLDNEVTILFEVEDSGIGIPQDKQDFIFNKFTQAEKHTSSKYGGTGLGLAICKGLVEQMDGHIGVKSEVGEGSTFWFQITVPIGKAVSVHKSNSQNTHKIDKNYVGKKILVAEDFPANQEVMRNILQKLGCEVDVAEDGEEVLQYVGKNKYDILLLDCIMPNMDGYQACKAIRAQEKEGEHLPIIAVTASTLEEDQKRCIESGMDAFIHKPVSVKKIQNVLGEYLSE